jgi:serine/threonine-protein phosphatase 2B catalytic subunit
MPSTVDKSHKLANALNQIQNKEPPPAIDFTIHKLEDGNTISTQERVIKEVC